METVDTDELEVAEIKTIAEIALTISPNYTQLICAAVILVAAYFLNAYLQQNKEDFRRLAEDLKRQLYKL